MLLDKIYYIDRRTQERVAEKVYCESFLRFLYTSYLGKKMGTCLAYFPFFSKFIGWWQRGHWTQGKISRFIAEYKLDTSEFETGIDIYQSFNDFFTRKLKKEARPLAAGPILPADGRYLVYSDISHAEGFLVKGKKFTLKKLLGNEVLADRYVDGSLMIARLCPTDYHRFHFPVDCVPGQPRLINGPLYSVNPIAVKKNIELLAENKRMVTELKTESYGTILFIEIGATTVGTIHQTFQAGKFYQKGEEKGFFSFGGSCIILLFEKKGNIHFASDLIANSSQYIETLCLMGQPLGETLNPSAYIS